MEFVVVVVVKEDLIAKGRVPTNGSMREAKEEEEECSKHPAVVFLPLSSRATLWTTPLSLSISIHWWWCGLSESVSTWEKRQH